MLSRGRFEPDIIPVHWEKGLGGAFACFARYLYVFQAPKSFADDDQNSELSLARTLIDTLHFQKENVGRFRNLAQQQVSCCDSCGA